MNVELKRNAAAEDARADLQPGESLLHCDIGKALVSSYGRLLLGLALIVAAIWSFSMGNADSDSEVAIITSSLQGIIFCVVFIALGLIFFFNALKDNFLSAGSYFFVTDRRLCLMQKNFTGKLVKTDIPITSVVKIDVVDSSSDVRRQGRSPGLKRFDKYVLMKTNEKQIAFVPRDPDLMRAFVLSAIDERKDSESGTPDNSPGDSSDSDI